MEGNLEPSNREQSQMPSMTKSISKGPGELKLPSGITVKSQIVPKAKLIKVVSIDGKRPLEGTVAKVIEPEERRIPLINAITSDPMEPDKPSSYRPDDYDGGHDKRSMKMHPPAERGYQSGRPMMVPEKTLSPAKETGNQAEREPSNYFAPPDMVSVKW